MKPNAVSELKGLIRVQVGSNKFIYHGQTDSDVSVASWILLVFSYSILDIIYGYC